MVSLNFDDTIWVNPETGLLEVKRQPNGNIENDSGLSVAEGFSTGWNTWDMLKEDGRLNSFASSVGTGNLDPGNGTYEGYWLVDGDTTYCTMWFKWGSTSSWGPDGGGTSAFNLRVFCPIQPAVPDTTSLFAGSGVMILWDNSASAQWVYEMRSTRENSLYQFVTATATAPSSTTTSPFTWATNDVFSFTGMYKNVPL